MTISLKIKRSANLMQALTRVSNNGIKAIEASLYQEGEAIMTESKNIVPVDIANLKDSGHVSPPKTAGNRTTIELGYGGPAAPYAIFVHEDMTAQHTSGQSAKYLSIPFNKRKRGFGSKLAQRIRAAL